MINLQNIIYLDFPISGQIGFQDAGTAIMQGIINLHHHIFFLITMVLIFVGLIFFETFQFSYWKKVSQLAAIETIQKQNSIKLANTLYFIKKLKTGYNLNVSHGVLLEIIWTIVPSLILLAIVGPSFALLYAMDAFVDPSITVKILAHQWYWTFEYSDFFQKPIYNEINSNKYLVNLNYNFDSYMVATSDLKKGELRLLEVDNALYLPTYSRLRLDVTSDDVMHSFAVPSLGIKIDAIPGRLNIAYAEILREGIYFGQCSELCGVNHGFMPLKIVAVNYSNYINYIILNSELSDSEYSVLNYALSLKLNKN
jgi:cytochrome c oxidase subunit 2